MKAKVKCDQGVSDSCGMAGSFLERGVDGRKEYDAAAKFYLRGCNLKDGYSCHRLATLHDFKRISTPSQEIAVKYYAIGCKFLEADACQNLGVHYEQGDGIAVNSNLALLYYEKGCSLDSEQSCSNARYLIKKFPQLARAKPVAPKTSQDPKPSQDASRCIKYRIEYQSICRSYLSGDEVPCNHGSAISGTKAVEVPYNICQ